MVTLNKLLDFFEERVPSCLAEDYDNVGLLIGDKDKKIQKILITLDVDPDVVEEAIVFGADLLISHHPLIFQPINHLCADDGQTKSILSLIKHDIALFAMHTNFDSVQGGLGDLFFEKLGKTTNVKPLDGEGIHGIGRIADFMQAVSLKDFLFHIKQTFHMQSVRFVGKEDACIKTVAAVNGGGAEYVTLAKKLGANCFLSGDIKYHQARFAYENELCLVEIPHYKAEIGFCDAVTVMLQQEFGAELETQSAKSNVDIWNCV